MLDVGGRLIMNEPKEILDPKHSAVIVVDMQKDFVSSTGKIAAAGNDVSAIQEIIPRLQAFLNEARARQLLCVHIQTLTLPDHRSDSDAWLYNKLKGVNSADWCLAGTWGAEIIDELAPLTSEPVVVKHRSSAFVNTTLDQILRSNGIATVIITGEQTPGCVEATYRDAAYHDYYNVLVSDCVAAYRQDLHEASLKIQRARHDVYTANEITDMWEEIARQQSAIARRNAVGASA
jgi:ureidoacrylate peracid hydrolase